jgi:hypothetical protein
MEFRTTLVVQIKKGCTSIPVQKSVIYALILILRIARIRLRKNPGIGNQRFY